MEQPALSGGRPRPDRDPLARVARTATAIASARRAADGFAVVVAEIRDALGATGVALCRADARALVPVTCDGLDVGPRPLDSSDPDPAAAGGYPLMYGDRLEGVLLLDGVGASAVAAAERDVAPLFDLAAIALRNARLDAERRVELARAERLVSVAARMTEIGRLLASSLDLDTVASAAVAASNELLGADYSALVLPDTGGRLYEHVRLAAAGAVNDASLAWAPGFGIVGRAFAEGRMLLVPDILSDVRVVHRRALADAGVRSLLVVPIRGANGAILGVLEALNRQVDAFTDDDADLLNRLADLTAVALHNARLLNEAAQERDRLVQVISVMPEGVTIVDADGETQVMNAAGHELVGRFTPRVPIDDADLIGSRRPDGRPFQLTETPLHRALVHGETVRGEQMVVAHGQTGEDVTLLINSAPLRGLSGEVVGAVSVFQDISELVRVQTALRDRDEQLRQAQKMEAIGRLAGGVAHDFNNLLSVILGYTELMLHQGNLGETSRVGLREIFKAGERAAGLTRQLLAFSRKQVLAPRVVHLNAIVADLQRMLGRLIGEDVELAVSLADHLGYVLADPGQIEQVLLNLVVNARDAMPRGGRLAVETRNVRLAAPLSTQNAVLGPGEYVVLVVQDTGAGIPAAILPRIFEPFFTTKPAGSGTGLGLATVYGIVEQSGGGMTVESGPGAGTRFAIYLPRVPAPGDADRQRERAAAVGGTETVLVVEDEDALRDLAGSVLEQHGYRVLLAADGESALRRATEFSDDIHLVLTDVVLPTMSGRELAEAIRAIRSPITVLYMSGHTDDAVRRRGLFPGGPAAFIQKPFTPAALVRRVRETLDGA